MFSQCDVVGFDEIENFDNKNGLSSLQIFLFALQINKPPTVAATQQDLKSEYAHETKKMIPRRFSSKTLLCNIQ